MSKKEQPFEEIEIDFDRYFELILRNFKIFLAVFCIVFASGLAYVSSFPKIYKISMLIQPPAGGEAFSGANDLESAENLGGLIANQAFNEELIKRLNLGLKTNDLKFFVVVPAKTNILEVSIDSRSEEKESGVILLKELAIVISNRYGDLVEANRSKISAQINKVEKAIIITKEKIKNFQGQIQEISLREQKLADEINHANANIAETFKSRNELLKDSSWGNLSVLLLTNFLQNNLNSLSQMNNQLSDLSIRKVKLGLEIKSLEFQISDFQLTADNLNKSKNFISNVRVVSQPSFYLLSQSTKKKKVVVFSLLIGLILSVAAVCAKEFWRQNIKRKIGK
jgi:LPS O-antigen subunit length determinant protein (WzzB/FepE family)